MLLDKQENTSVDQDEKTENPSLMESASDRYSINFSGSQKSCCVGIVSLVKPSIQMNFLLKAKYSQIFLNSVAKILAQFGAVIIKNKEDMLLYYFPQSSKTNRKYGFMSCLESCLTLIDEKNIISFISEESGCPPIDFRISVDYGKVAVMQSNFSSNPDLIGPTVNICSKINSLAPINEVVLGSDLYEVVKKFHDYKYKKLGQYSVGLKQSYPVYLLESQSNAN